MEQTVCDYFGCPGVYHCSFHVGENIHSQCPRINAALDSACSLKEEAKTEMPQTPTDDLKNLISESSDPNITKILYGISISLDRMHYSIQSMETSLRQEAEKGYNSLSNRIADLEHWKSVSEETKERKREFSAEFRLLMIGLIATLVFDLFITFQERQYLRQPPINEQTQTDTP